jgi:hypothetical protein
MDLAVAPVSVALLQRKLQRSSWQPPISTVLCFATFSIPLLFQPTPYRRALICVN